MREMWNSNLGWKYNDGGRYCSRTRWQMGAPRGDCFVRSVAIAENKSYDEAWAEVNDFVHYEPPIICRNRMGYNFVHRPSSAQNGVAQYTCAEFLKMYGWEPHKPALIAPFDSYQDLFKVECERTNHHCIVEVPQHIFCVNGNYIEDEFDIRKSRNPYRSILLRLWTKERKGSYDASYAMSRANNPPITEDMM